MYDNYNRLLKYYIQQKEMIATKLNFIRQPAKQYDNKSQASTEGQENYDFNSCDNFALSLNNFHDSKTVKSKVKSSLCRNYTEKGFCPYGPKCQFAHGTHELRINLDVNNSYKTKLCNAFIKKGHCQYGYRCNFVHSEPSLMSQETKWKKIYSNSRQFFQGIKEGSASRLSQILE